MLFLTEDGHWAYQDDLIVTELSQGELIKKMHSLTLVTDGLFKFQNVKGITADKFMKLDVQCSKDLKKIDESAEPKEDNA